MNQGFRYELFTIAKGIKSPSCVIHMATSDAQCRERNVKSPDGYPSDVFEALVMRFECPDSRSRWDSPLFTVEPHEPIPCAEVANALFGVKEVKPNMSTTSQPVIGGNNLHEVDRATQIVVADVARALGSAMPGDTISVSGADVHVVLTRASSVPELHRIRRQFLRSPPPPIFKKCSCFEGACTMYYVFAKSVWFSHISIIQLLQNASGRRLTQSGFSIRAFSQHSIELRIKCTINVCFRLREFSGMIVFYYQSHLSRIKRNSHSLQLPGLHLHIT